MTEINAIIIGKALSIMRRLITQTKQRLAKNAEYGGKIPLISY